MVKNVALPLRLMLTLAIANLVAFVPVVLPMPTAMAQSFNLTESIPLTVSDSVSDFVSDPDPTVRIDGSNTMSAISRALKQQFQRDYPGTDVILNTRGTETALEELLNDEIDLAAIGRPLTNAEKAKGLKEIPVSLEKIAVIVGAENPFQGNLTVEQFVQILRGEITDWADVGGPSSKIWLIDRPFNSDTRLALSQYNLFAEEEFATGENVIRIKTDDTAAVIRQLGRDGIGYAIASQLANQDKARIVQLAVLYNTLPDDPLYPYSQIRGYAYKAGNADAIAQSFLEFAVTDLGQVAVAAAKAEEAKALDSEFKPIIVLPKLPILGKAPAPKEVNAPTESVPVAQTDTANATDTDRRLSLWWLLLPLLLVALLLRWLAQRFFSTRLTRQPAASSTSKVSTSEATTPAAKAETTGALEDRSIAEPLAQPPEATPIVPLSDVSTAPDVAPTEPETVANLAVADETVAETMPDAEVAAFKQTFLNMLRQRGQAPDTASSLDCYLVLATLMRDRLLQLNTPEIYLRQPNARIVGEIAAEYMPGPHLENNLLNLEIYAPVCQALTELGLNPRAIFDQEEEPGLGRGSLGQVMVCYLDSLSTQAIPAIGYGIRYELGIFDQEIQDGWQVEVADEWLRYGNPWEIQRPEGTVEVKFGGYTQAYMDEIGHYRVRWIPDQVVQGHLYDTPIIGYRTNTVSLLRLWQAETSSNLCKVLYPVDVELQGKELRLKQQFFLVSCALQDAIRLHLQTGGAIATLPERFALQLNDTDSTLAIVELMRLLLDEHGISWETAWETSCKTLAYTNHSVMPETLDDQWSLEILKQVLPRHLEIIYEINARFLEEVRSIDPDDQARVQRLSLIDETHQSIRLTHLATLGSHAVNGVSPLHTMLLRGVVIPDFYEQYPEKFSTQTNGVSPRRFLRSINPGLAELITRTIGDRWVTNLEDLHQLEAHANDPSFCQEWRHVKQTVKQDLTDYIYQQTGIEVDPRSLFDVQATLIHEYKRQHLNLLHILTLYNRIKANPDLDILPRTFIFAGKAAPDYLTAKLIIKLIHSVAAVVNSDSDVRGRLKVVFLKDFTIKSGRYIYPAIDLVESISTAGTEACDTGNMIACMNGAVLIGSPDGSNLEIQAAVGAENCFIFGLDIQAGLNLKLQGYHSWTYYNANSELKAALDLLTSGTLANGDTELFKPLFSLLMEYDQYLLLADYQSYLNHQEQISQAFQNPDRWTHASILNTTRIGKFSSDRAIQEYSQTIWQIQPTPAQSQDYALS
ncbi:MAG: hypothetical protein Kow00121_03740 [Elainellaceae cyanobacterium]